MNLLIRCLKPWLTLAIAMNPVAGHAQAAHVDSIPVRQVAPSTMSRESFFQLPDVRGLPGGRVLVNDQWNRRLLVFDSTLAAFTVSADSARTTGVLYPNMTTFFPLMVYAGDSSLLMDSESTALLVVDGSGRIDHPIAHPVSRDLRNTAYNFVGHPAGDQHGRLYYTASSTTRPKAKDGDSPITDTRDTTFVVRVDFNRRVVDTVAQFSIPRGNPPIVYGTGANGKATATRIINPMPQGPDDWAVLADGTLAIVREHDYHVDFIAPDGAMRSSAKLPFDWRRITDDEKRARIDSMQRIVDSATASGRPPISIRTVPGSDGGRSRNDTIVVTTQFVPLSKMPDYVPPIRNGSVRADADNNIWILPATTSQAGAGLLYDVVNKQGELFERVRLPANSVLAGFGKDGVLILAKRDPTARTWRLERTHVIR